VKPLVKKHMSTTSPMTTFKSGQMASVSNEEEWEAVNQWSIALSRNIDLEGITTEGYGYTVIVSGPPRPPRHRVWIPQFLTGGKEKRISQTTTAHTNKTLTSCDIPIKTTEVEVTADYPDTKNESPPNFWQSLDERDMSDMRKENMEFITSFDDKNDHWGPLKSHSQTSDATAPEEKPEPITALPPVVTKPSNTKPPSTKASSTAPPFARSFFNDLESTDEDIQALPQMNPMTEEDITVQSSGFKRGFHARSWTKGG
jgi:hypothetical protein